MATFTFTAFPLAITITVRGVSSGDVVRFFVRTDPGNVTIIDEQYTATSTSITRTFEGLEERTDYAVNAGVVTGNSTDWIGTQYFTTPSQGGSGGNRPDDWYWESTIASGRTINISASEWNDFCDRINEFRDYDGLSSYSFTRVYRGDPIEASIVNEARSAISAISTSGNVPGRVYSGDPIYADIFLDLRDALNETS